MWSKISSKICMQPCDEMHAVPSYFGLQQKAHVSRAGNLWFYSDVGESIRDLTVLEWNTAKQGFKFQFAGKQNLNQSIRGITSVFVLDNEIQKFTEADHRSVDAE